MMVFMGFILLIGQRLQSEFLVRRLRRAGACVAKSARVIGAPVVQVELGSRLDIGARVRLISSSRRTALGVNHPVVLRTLTKDAHLVISDDSGMSGGSICAALRIEIGAGAMLGANVTITDTDFHPLDHMWRRYQPIPTPCRGDEVLIGRNVFIGTGAVILKGTVLGDHCVVGAGAVVKGKFPGRTVIAGNPARAVRSLDDVDVPTP